MTACFVTVDDVIRVVKKHGSDARLDGTSLTIYPKNPARSVWVYEVMPEGVARRLVSAIAERVDVPTREFWNAADADERTTASDASSSDTAKKPSWLPGPL